MTGGGGGGPCATGLSFCNSRCVSTSVDENNCGGCGISCGSSQACNSGTCQNNPTDCRQTPCLAGFYCDLANGQCRSGCSANTQCPMPGTCNMSSRTCECASGNRMCGGACVADTSTESCGSTCIKCEKANATPACTNDQCVYTCNQGFNRCGSDCFAEDDITHCGTSCTACPAPPTNGSAECALLPSGTGGGGGGGGTSTRQCAVVCNPGFFKCASGCCRANAIAAGGDTTCALVSGTVKCWGATEGTLIPTDITGIDAGVTSIAMGAGHACAIRSDGRVMCWGGNDYGQLGDGTGTYRPDPVFISGSTTFTSLTAGNWFTCGVTSTGGASCWGHNVYGELGIGTFSPTQCTSGQCNFYDVPYQVSGLTTGVARVDGAWGHACAQKLDGSLWCWGRNLFSQLGVATPGQLATPRNTVTSGVVQLSVGGDTTCFIQGGSPQCLGSNLWGELGAGLPFNTESDVPVNISLSGITALFGGKGDVHCATTASGLSCWGHNDFGQVGDGSKMNRATPVPVAVPSTVTSVATGDDHTCALTVEGAVYCWGSNVSGQLGDGTRMERLTPTVVSGR